MKACVIGHPIQHSKSPLIHNYWLNQNNIDGQYDAIDITPENLKDGIRQLLEKGYDGFNVTIPHKQNIIKLCDEIDDTARMIGAINTVIIQEGKLYGRNTDAFGFIQNIKTHRPDFDFKNKSALILGAGGAARAIIYGLLQEGIGRIIVVNRTIEKAEELRDLEPAQIEIKPWEERSNILKNIDILVNSTSLGMTQKPALEIDLNGLPEETLVCDIVYAPLMTDLLNAARACGNDIVTGIGMLLHQARPAFEAWTGTLPDVTPELEKLVLE